ncbi:lipopolysaccharide transport periplasmic protein LptA [Vogesella sp. LIG4]|uniref:lipopolysaccharide transport periplasmic protein LptA n=1 Tax=Vogesella sp. LIG4 TaxID=1192162 RepID=UPI00081FD94A|nr:lipopolysaccharide transport periplasmic protein LptA [Vogesella sp. LIG4]SCK17825.1 lipopolysaccharide export system protein LptA [Vogesella sp. LIG4]
MRHSLMLALILGLSGVAANVYAERADSNKPIELAADRGSLDQKQGINILEGNVVATQGTLTLHADKTIVTRDTQGNQTLQAFGNPATFRQKVEGKNEYVDGQGSRVDYTSASNQVILTGKARVKRGQDLVTGEQITYNTVTEIYQVAGNNPTASGAAKGRVTVILQPKAQEKP